jgi:hypothetical protein
MRLPRIAILLFFAILFLGIPVSITSATDEIIVTDADSTWNSDLVTPSPDVVDSGDAQTLIKYAFVSHADTVWETDLKCCKALPVNESPIASFTRSPENVFSGDVVSFNASGSYDPDGTIVTYEWDFGDGENATGQQVTHRFRGAMGQSKAYDVTLTVKDSEGDASEASIYVSVNPLTKTVAVDAGYFNTVSCWMKVTYNWIGFHETSGLDDYCISEVSSYCGGLAGGYQLLILDHASGEEMWGIALPALPIEEHYDVTKYESSIWQDHFGKPCQPVEFPTPEGVFKGIGVTDRDSFLIMASGTALPPLLYFDLGITQFAPDSPVKHFKQKELKWLWELKDVLDLLNKIIGLMGSPAELRIYDSQGRVTGLVNGEAKEQIPYSYCDSDSVIVFSPTDSYRYEVVGMEEGNYGLELNFLDGGEVIDFTATDIPIALGTVHEYTIDWDALSRGENGVTVQVDSNGDGITDYTLTAGSVLTGDEFVPPPMVTTQAATYVGRYFATLNMNYTVGNSTSVDVRFAYKKSTDTAWSYTAWVSKTMDGTYAVSLEDLYSSTATKYDFKAQLKYDDTVIEGNTLYFFIPAPPSGCFIATAAYGTPMAEEIQILREFRDDYLLTNPAGQALVDFYYRVSPPIADFITEHPSLKPLVRVGLVPVVSMSSVVVNTSPTEKMAIGLLTLVSISLAVWATRRRGRGSEYT